MDDKEIKKLIAWTTLKTEKGPELPLFDVELRSMENPRNGEHLQALVLHADDTVNVIALDSDQHVLLVEQFRFGIDAPVLELPAGFIDQGESPLEAAKRELLEETGYSGMNWTGLGFSYVNPSYVTNRCYHFLAQDVHFERLPNPDLTEDLLLHRIELQSIIGSASAGLPILDAIGRAAILQVLPHLSLPSQQ
ncbi:MAG: NUDIX hydrolase [Saprospiraceae bacterium]|nr:NUDIX hydrolase [Saprospiraceae bacterium]